MRSQECDLESSLHSVEPSQQIQSDCDARSRGSVPTSVDTHSRVLQHCRRALCTSAPTLPPVVIFISVPNRLDVSHSLLKHSTPKVHLRGPATRSLPTLRARSTGSIRHAVGFALMTMFLGTLDVRFGRLGLSPVRSRLLGLRKEGSVVRQTLGGTRRLEA